MNGNTRLKLEGGVIGGLIGALVSCAVAFASVSYGYGQLNNRVAENEKKTSCITEVKERLARIETKLERINFHEIEALLASIERKMK